MWGKAIIGAIIIFGVVFSFITIVRIRDFPVGDCCHDLEIEGRCRECDSFTWYEQVIYVWRYSDELN